MLRDTALERFTKNQRKQLSLITPMGTVTRDLEHALNALDEILVDYELHDWCDHPSYRRYYRMFDITARAFLRVTKVLSLPGGPKFI